MIITELASSKLLQIKVRNILDFEKLVESISKDDAGYQVRKYAVASCAAGQNC